MPAHVSALMCDCWTDPSIDIFTFCINWTWKLKHVLFSLARGIMSVMLLPAAADELSLNDPGLG